MTKPVILATLIVFFSTKLNKVVKLQFEMQIYVRPKSSSWPEFTLAYLEREAHRTAQIAQVMGRHHQPLGSVGRITFR